MMNTTSNHKRRTWPVILGTMLLGLLTFTALGNIAGSEWGWLRKLVHFPAFTAPAAMGLGIWFALQRLRVRCMLASVLGAGFALQVSALWLADNAPPPPAALRSPVSVMTFNVFKHSRQHALVLSTLQSAKPDVLFLTETSPEWHRALAPLRQIYPHSLGTEGNLLLSRWPLEDARNVTVSFEAALNASAAAGEDALILDESLRSSWPNPEVLAATVLVPDSRLRVAGIHPATPRSGLAILTQRAVALVCRQELAADPRARARLLVGDFNTTCFSPTFRFILEHTGLKDSARGFGYAPTWGPGVPHEPLLPWLGIPIDHVLVSENITVQAREVGPPLGSDHRWVMVKILW